MTNEANSGIENKTVLVTGGAGFIGSHICHKLIALGAKVKCYDNLITGKKKNIESLMTNNNFEFVEEDISNFEALKNSTRGVDIICHQAALGSVPRSISNPLNTNQTNVSGTLNVFEAARIMGVNKVVFASSSSVYGDVKSTQKTENNLGEPLSPYALTKLFNEYYAEIYRKTYNLNYIGLRYFNVFGARQDPNGPYAAVIPKFINLFLDNKPIIVNGDGLHSRDFTHIDNVVHANLIAMLANNNALNQNYNVGCGGEYTLNELIYHLKKNISILRPDLKLKVEYGPERKGDVKSSKACIEKIKKNLNYFVKVGFEDGIKDLIIHSING